MALVRTWCAGFNIGVSPGTALFFLVGSTLCVPMLHLVPPFYFWYILYYFIISLHFKFPVQLIGAHRSVILWSSRDHRCLSFSPIVNALVLSLPIARVLSSIVFTRALLALSATEDDTENGYCIFYRDSNPWTSANNGDGVAILDYLPPVLHIPLALFGGGLPIEHTFFWGETCNVANARHTRLTHSSHTPL